MSPPRGLHVLHRLIFGKHKNIVLLSEATMPRILIFHTVQPDSSSTDDAISTDGSGVGPF